MDSKSQMKMYRPQQISISALNSTPMLPGPSRSQNTDTGAWQSPNRRPHPPKFSAFSAFPENWLGF